MTLNFRKSTTTILMLVASLGAGCTASDDANPPHVPAFDDGLFEGDEALNFGESTSGLRKGQGGVDGDLGFCNHLPGPALCVSGEGDCDNDAECAAVAGNICGTNNGARYGFLQNWDVCAPATCFDGVANGTETTIDDGPSCGDTDVCVGLTNPDGDPNRCSHACPCAAANGDCDRDNDCTGTGAVLGDQVVCVADVGARFNFPAIIDVCLAAHCRNRIQDAGETSIDAGGECAEAICPNGIPGEECTPSCPCASSFGDCDVSADCQPGLSCFEGGLVDRCGPSSRIDLGAAGNFVILSQSGISTVPASVITGDLGVSPAAATAITGFSLTMDATNVFSRSPQVTGRVFAADYAVPSPSNLTTAVSRMRTAFTAAAGRAPGVTELGAGNIGGMTLSAGVYYWSSSLLIPSNVTLTGNATDVFIFQIAGDLTASSATNIFLTGGARPENIFWQVSGLVELGTTSHFEGIVLSQTSIHLRTGASINGRLFAQTAVTLDTATVVQPAQ